MRRAGLDPASSAFLDSRLRGNDSLNVFNGRSNINTFHGIFRTISVSLSFPFKIRCWTFDVHWFFNVKTTGDLH
jgi:hypothetical protein